MYVDLSNWILYELSHVSLNKTYPPWNVNQIVLYFCIWLPGFGGLNSKVTKLRSLSMDRAKGTTRQVIQDYYQELDGVLTKYTLKDLPQLIYNLDEMGISTEHVCWAHRCLRSSASHSFTPWKYSYHNHLWECNWHCIACLLFVYRQESESEAFGRRPRSSWNSNCHVVLWMAKQLCNSDLSWEAFPCRP